MKNSLLCSIAVAAINFSGYSQHHISIAANSGIGKLATVFSLENQENAIVGSTVSNKYKATYGLDVNYSFGFNRFILESGLSYNFIKGFQTEHFNIYKDFSGLYYDRFDVDVVRNVHYLTLPFLAKWQQHKISVGIGGFVSYMLTNSSAVTFFKNADFYGYQQGGNNLNRLNCGLRGMIGYDLTEQFTLQFSSNIGLSDLNDGSERGAKYTTYQIAPVSLQLKSRQYMVGIRYYLL